MIQCFGAHSYYEVLLSFRFCSQLVSVLQRHFPKALPAAASLLPWAIIRGISPQEKGPREPHRDQTQMKSSSGRIPVSEHGQQSLPGSASLTAGLFLQPTTSPRQTATSLPHWSPPFNPVSSHSLLHPPHNKGSASPTSPQVPDHCSPQSPTRLSAVCPAPSIHAPGRALGQP